MLKSRSGLLTERFLSRGVVLAVGDADSHDHGVLDGIIYTRSLMLIGGVFMFMTIDAGRCWPEHEVAHVVVADYLFSCFPIARPETSIAHVCLTRAAITFLLLLIVSGMSAGGEVPSILKERVKCCDIALCRIEVEF